MAKSEYQLRGDFDSFLSMVDKEILKGSISATFVDGSSVKIGDVRCDFRVYERYSMFGGNRVSLNITLLGDGDNNLFLSAITAGGSQAVLVKINTFSENNFLRCLDLIVEKYKRAM